MSTHNCPGQGCTCRAIGLLMPPPNVYTTPSGVAAPGLGSIVQAVPLDSKQATTLTRAAKNARKWTAERDRLIVEAVQQGAGVREVGRAVELSHPAVIKIVGRAS